MGKKKQTKILTKRSVKMRRVWEYIDREKIKKLGKVRV